MKRHRYLGPARFMGHWETVIGRCHRLHPSLVLRLQLQLRLWLLRLLLDTVRRRQTQSCHGLGPRSPGSIVVRLLFD